MIDIDLIPSGLVMNAALIAEAQVENVAFRSCNGHILAYVKLILAAVLLLLPLIVLVPGCLYFSHIHQKSVGLRIPVAVALALLRHQVQAVKRLLHHGSEIAHQLAELGHAHAEQAALVNLVGVFLEVHQHEN